MTNEPESKSEDDKESIAPYIVAICAGFAILLGLIVFSEIRQNEKSREEGTKDEPCTDCEH